jgi:hypothetical protein
MTNAFTHAPPSSGAALDQTAVTNLRKRVATLHAELALAGFTLSTTTDDHGEPLYIISRWALTRQLGSVEAVAAFARQVLS